MSYSNVLLNRNNLGQIAPTPSDDAQAAKLRAAAAETEANPLEAQAETGFGSSIFEAAAAGLKANKFSLAAMQRTVSTPSRGYDLLPSAGEPLGASTLHDAATTDDTTPGGQSGLQLISDTVFNEISAQYGPQTAYFLTLLDYASGGTLLANYTPTGTTPAAAKTPTTDPESEPSISAADQANGVHYATIPNASLWGDGSIQGDGKTTAETSAADLIDQGSLGDCYFLSSLSNLATSDPQALQNMVRQKPGGTADQYQVSFNYKDPNSGTYTQEWVDVDNSFPVGTDGKTVYDHLPLDGSGQPVIGIALIEKAWAKFNDEHGIVGTNGDTGYAAIGDGGTGIEAMEAVTGKDAQSVNASATDATQSLADAGLSQATFLSYLSQANPPNNLPVQIGTKATDSTDPNNDTLPSGVVAGHDYAVMGTYKDPTTGATMVKLRNPWGNYASAGGGTGTNGIFAVPLSSLMADTYSVNMQTTTQNALPSTYNQASSSLPVLSAAAAGLGASNDSSLSSFSPKDRTAVRA